MKITHIFWALGYGGIETMLINIANEQSKLEADVSVIIINDLIAPELITRLSPNVLLVRLNRKLGSKSFSFVNKLNENIYNIQPDVIHLHDGLLYNYLSSNLLNKISCSVCCTLHDMPYGTCGIAWKIGRLVQNLLLHQGGNVMNLNRVGRVFSISNAVAYALKEKYGVNSTVICNGIQTRKFSMRKNSPCKGNLRIVQVGRLVHLKKGQDLLIEAIRKIELKGIPCEVDFIGDGESKNYLQRMVEEKQLKSSIRFLGAKPQSFLMEHLCDYDLFVQPSRYEGFGLTVAEAMSANVPVLVSSGQGPAEITENEKYGWTFKCDEVNSLAENIEYIYNHYSLCLQKVDLARCHVIENYDVSITAKKYLTNYR